MGSLPDSLPASVPRALRQLAGSAPALEVDMTTGTSLWLFEDLRAGRHDAIVTTLAPAACRS
jgi:DNA-binding transcriptional LysR family regulator